ncbi:hypothetical protein [Vibrio vulnificus]|uniref:hypothetical protein n=1 Tax=Vibrio vulnificus TaxID=672 RepID=UPI001FAFB299|nr:hypothetical protein [Vibrio vulnificus]MCJ0804049.1 hypothetical protein [Vibrio vulnificus]
MKLKDILNRDDQDLFHVCQRVFGKVGFIPVKQKALQAAADAARNEPDMKKINAARRAINSVLIAELKIKGVTNWRKLIRK